METVPMSARHRELLALFEHHLETERRNDVEACMKTLHPGIVYEHPFRPGEDYYLEGTDAVAGQFPAVVELHPAPPAMVEFAASQQPLQQIQKTAVEPVDVVAFPQPHHAVGSADRTTASRTQVIAEPVRRELLAVTLGAFVNGQVVEAFEERPVDPPQLSATLSALEHFLLPCGLALL